jgi:hypothetical protein
VRDALAQVPPRQRAVPVLRYLCGLLVADVAAILGCSPGTVKSQAAHGLAALRRLLGEPRRPRGCHRAKGAGDMDEFDDEARRLLLPLGDATPPPTTVDVGSLVRAGRRLVRRRRLVGVRDLYGTRMARPRTRPASRSCSASAAASSG